MHAACSQLFTSSCLSLLFRYFFIHKELSHHSLLKISFWSFCFVFLSVGSFFRGWSTADQHQSGEPKLLSPYSPPTAASLSRQTGERQAHQHPLGQLAPRRSHNIKTQTWRYVPCVNKEKMIDFVNIPGIDYNKDKAGGVQEKNQINVAKPKY